MATTDPMAASSARMAGRFCQAARKPFRKASAMAEPRGDTALCLKGLAAAARLLGVRVHDAEPRPGQPVLVIDDRAGQVDKSALVDKKPHAMAEEFLVTSLA